MLILGRIAEQVVIAVAVAVVTEILDDLRNDGAA
jgi:hypothetical protein